ncbi:cytidylyltransferase family-domain-containing protein [Lactarius vividus]|nr:cytidylyltransferase family-domain-containing protein [Lactarius vividus]
MSKPQVIQSKSSVASRTAFDILTVESGEESEEEQVSEPEAVVASVVDAPSKPSKTALKKAAKAARQEKKQKSRALSASGGDTSEAGQSPSAPTLPLAPSPAPDNGPVAVLDQHLVGPSPLIESPKPSPPLANTISAPIEKPRPVLNGHHVGAKGGSQPPNQESSVSSSIRRPVMKVPPVRPSSSPSKPVPQPSEPKPRPPKADKEPVPISSKPVANLEADKAAKKGNNVLVRTLWTFIMIGGFMGCLLMGHVCMIILVFICQTIVYREVTRLFTLLDSIPVEDRRKDPWSKTLNWYFFATANYFLYGESIIYYFKHVVFADANFLPFAANHRIISFTLYTIGFVGFVMSLKKGYLKQQFGLFCWVHMTLLLIVVSSHFIMNNILEGLIWFFVPASLVVCNDVFAYVCGITMGRTPLIKLSPKKTVEGFVGAFLCTVVFAIMWGTFFSKFNYMICPVHDLGENAWSNMKCTPNPVFVWREWVIWPPVAKFLSTILPGDIHTISYTPYQFHLLFMACFASLVAPFGGFFASGFKRAFNIKDFGDSIPGHGGMTDRMDCQFLMGVFVYVYYTSFIREHHATVGSVLQTIVSGLTIEEQLELIDDLKHYLRGQGITI